MKKLITFAALIATTLFSAGSVMAASGNANQAANNPNTVAYYPDGTHTVIQPDGSIAFGQPGSDYVLKAGNTGNVPQNGNTVQQFYHSPDGGVHTVFRNIGNGTSCPDNWVFIQNPNQPPTGDTWGNYFPSGDNYCAKSNNTH